MIGAIIGDIVGSRFEWHNIKTKKFELFTEKCEPTDDSVMSLALCGALMMSAPGYEALEANAVKEMQRLGLLYPDAGYGGSFRRWIISPLPQPYNSFGNGAAMRVSGCGWAAESLRQAKELARTVTGVTHDHPEGLKAGEATAAAVYMARTGSGMEEIKRFIHDNYYRIDFTLDSIRAKYSFDVTCQGSVPQAFEAFFESNGFEDAIRNAISIGGDSDTIAAITGGIAGAYYGVPADIRRKALNYLDGTLSKILTDFERSYSVPVGG